MALNVETVVVTPFQQNCRVLWDSASREAVVLDPGGEVGRILEVIRTLNLLVKEIWLTHSHIDHAGGVVSLRGGVANPVKLVGHLADKFLRENIAAQGSYFGLPEGEYLNCPEPDEYVSQGSVVRLGENIGEVRFVPGHAPGHVIFVFSSNNSSLAETGAMIVFAGDTLFAGSVGRTDLPGGNGPQLLRGIREQILTLPDNTIVLPGHGPSTTVGEEKMYNSYLQ